MSIVLRSSRLMLILTLAGFTSFGLAQESFLGQGTATRNAWREAVAATQHVKSVDGVSPPITQSPGLQDKLNDTARTREVLQQILQRIAKSAKAAQPNAAQQGGSQVTPTLASILGVTDEREANLRQNRLFPHASIGGGWRHPSELSWGIRDDLDAIPISMDDGTTVSLKDWRKRTSTDGLLVMHRGQIVYERYSRMMPWERHATWSVSKSLTGLIAADLIQEGSLDANAPIAHYLPELRDSAWADATVQQTLDMTTGVGYEEAITVDKPGVVQYLVAAGLMKAPDGYSGARNMVDFLKSLHKSGEHGRAFSYKSVDTEVVGLLLERITGKHYAQLVSERIWKPMGSVMNAYVLQDGSGTQLSGMGINGTLRDLARLAEMIRLDGRYNGRQILQPSTVAELRKGGDPAALKAGGVDARRWTGYSYHDFWWFSHDADGTMEAKGFSGQHIHVNPAAELVIVKLSSFGPPDPFATHAQDRRAFAAIAQAVRGL